MKLCSHCGVILDNTMQNCPLCEGGSSGYIGITIKPDTSSLVDGELETMPVERELSRNQKRKMFWELSTLILFLGIVVTLIVDFVTSSTISWSKFTIIVGLVLFIIISLLSFVRHRPVVLGCGIYLSLSLFLLTLDKLISNTGWGIELGIPLLSLIYVFILAFSFLAGILKEKGLNLIGYFFLLSGLIIPTIEIVLDNFFSGNINLVWSIYVIASLLPMGVVLLFVHYRMRKGRELKRLFHI